MSFLYDYSELLEDIADKVLTTDSFIYIVRGKKKQLTESDAYNPIIDYFYNDELSDVDVDIREETEKEAPQISGVEIVSVLAAITEMQMWNSIC